MSGKLDCMAHSTDGARLRLLTRMPASIETGESTRYDLLYTDEDEGVKVIAECGTEIGEAIGFWKIEELTRTEVTRICSG
ncbi:hypothetical protein CP556_20620 [Natrinema sp. CBA1119]|uniref:hypothetical protein n=1 Tax=Natrinema sp. CBA1119 TaxID=1608465 RepID=UPI000BF856AA|nr:hypothetical protein [Natrinema sp. CBA1119]PGF14518.1 hypothetical protein CP556_20620 [Natrinema sp. CBA1119]